MTVNVSLATALHLDYVDLPACNLSLLLQEVWIEVESLHLNSCACEWRQNKNHSTDLGKKGQLRFPFNVNEC